MTSKDDYNLVEFQDINIDRSRRVQLVGWLRSLVLPEVQALWSEDTSALMTPASSDASFRRYFRLSSQPSARTQLGKASGSSTKPINANPSEVKPSWVVMDAPVKLEATAPFVEIASLLKEADVNSPKILAWNQEQGFILLEDFGRQTYLDYRNSTKSTSPSDNNSQHLRHPARDAKCDNVNARAADQLGQSGAADDWPNKQKNSVEQLYKDAIDALVRMQAKGRVGQLPVYTQALLNTEMELFRHWLLLRHLGRSWSRHDEQQWQLTKGHLCADALKQEQVFVHRDYHSRNLMVLSSADANHKNPGVLDFQDAVKGPIFYDLMSLLKDCYAAFSDDQLEHYLVYYFAQIKKTSLKTQDSADQRQLLHSIGVQRHLKAAGIFARLWHRDGKAGYLKDIPRTLNYIVDAAQDDHRLEWLAQLVQHRVLPCLEKVS